MRKTPLFGAHNASEPFGRSYFGINSSGAPEIGGGDGYRYYSNTKMNANERYTVDLDNTVGSTALVLNGISQTPTGGTAYAEPYSSDTLWILAVNTTDTSWFENASAKLYLIKIYAGGATLVFNGIPCKNPNNEIGLYDTISKQFFGNSGTGEFTGE